MFVLIVLGVGTFGLGHDHAESGPLDEFHCVVCHVQHTITMPASVADVEPMANPGWDARCEEPGRLGSIAALLGPPLRGPPIA